MPHGRCAAQAERLPAPTKLAASQLDFAEIALPLVRELFRCAPQRDATRPRPRASRIDQKFIDHPRNFYTYQEVTEMSLRFSRCVVILGERVNHPPARGD